VTSGVANFVSAFPSAQPYVLKISIALVVMLTLTNLRGIKESGKAFALPTYLFIGSVLLMIGMGIYRRATGEVLEAPTAHLHVPTQNVSQMMLIFLILRAFASGCTALTGVEAISNGVPYFRSPKPENASRTLLAMGALAVTMFLGVTWLAVTSHAKIADNPVDLGLSAHATQQTIIAQLGTTIFGAGSAGFYVLQLATTFVLVLAANTSYNSFPIMASVLGRDGFLPRQFGRRGDRLVYSNGVIILATAAGALIWAYDASVTHLVQLYILGVFLSFTISQAGMVRYWRKKFANPEHTRSPKETLSMATNFLGATITAVVLVIVVVTKFTHGAWIVVIAIPILTFMMNGIRRHYISSDIRLAATPGGVSLPSSVRAIVLISKVNAPSLQALAYAQATRPTSLQAVHVVTDEGRAENVKSDWDARGLPLDLVMLESPFRDVTGPVMNFLTGMRETHPRDLITVYVPEYVSVHWWEQLLHNQTALRIKRKLLFEPGIVVTNVPLVGTRQNEESLSLASR